MAERLKNLLLALLLLTMLALLVLTFAISVRGSLEGQPLLQPGDESEGFGGELSRRLLARAEVLAILGPEGVSLSAWGEERELLYQQTEPLLQEAVGSAGLLEPLAEQDYLDLLSHSGVLLQFHDAQPWYLLQAWGGSETLEEGLLVSAAVMVATEERVALLLTDHAGSRWKADTAASLSELETLCAGGGRNNARLAADSGTLMGDEVLALEAERCPSMTALPPEIVARGELSQSVQSIFGMNAYLTRVYQNTDGSLVYVESHNTVSLTPEGDLTYVGAQGIDLELSETGLARKDELCQKVCSLMNRLWEQAGASGRLSLEHIELEQDSGLLRFALHVNGRFAERQKGSWATVTVQDGTVVGLTAALRLLETGEEEILLPMHLAAAALPEGRAALRLRLLERGDGQLLPRLCRVSEE